MGSPMRIRFVVVEKVEQLHPTENGFKLVLRSYSDDHPGRLAFAVDLETFLKIKLGQSVLVDVTLVTLVEDACEPT
jgi:hypothetical protein